MIRLASLAALLVMVGMPLGAQDDKGVNLGIVDSLVKDLSPAKKNFVEKDFAEMVFEHTGIKTKVHPGGDRFTAAKKLASGEWQLGIFQGVEFAWAQAKDPALKPLVVGIGNQRTLHAQVIVKNDSPLKAPAELKGKDVNLYASSKDHCRLFADKLAQGNSKEFYGKLIRANGAEEALDDVLLGKVQAAIVDNNSMQGYKDIHPGRFARLKVLVQSESFPLGVIGYREGSVSNDVLNRFRDGMLKSNQTDKGREGLASFHLTALEPVPADFAQQLSAILKSYPAEK
jgi:ABC-type phosphate/phosphonate transport system substrate-binding protein